MTLPSSNRDRRGEGPAVRPGKAEPAERRHHAVAHGGVAQRPRAGRRAPRQRIGLAAVGVGRLAHGPVERDDEADTHGPVQRRVVRRLVALLESVVPRAHHPRERRGGEVPGHALALGAELVADAHEQLAALHLLQQGGARGLGVGLALDGAQGARPRADAGEPRAGVGGELGEIGVARLHREGQGLIRRQLGDEELEAQRPHRHAPAEGHHRGEPAQRAERLRQGGAGVLRGGSRRWSGGRVGHDGRRRRHAARREPEDGGEPQECVHLTHTHPIQHPGDRVQRDRRARVSSSPARGAGTSSPARDRRPRPGT